MNTPVDETIDRPRTLSRDVTGLKGLLDQRRGEEDVDAQLRNLNPISTNLDQLSRDLTGLQELLAEAEKKGITVERPDCPVDPQQFADLATSARDNGMDLVDCTTTVSELTGARRDLSNALDQEWKAHCDCLLPNPKGYEELLKALGEVDGIRGVAKAKAQTGRAIDIREGKFSGELADKFAELAKAIVSAVEVMVGDSQEVVEFLLGAAEVGTPLDELLANEPLLKWLEEKDLLKSFRVLAGSPQRGHGL